MAGNASARIFVKVPSLLTQLTSARKVALGFRPGICSCGKNQPLDTYFKMSTCPEFAGSPANCPATPPPLMPPQWDLTLCSGQARRDTNHRIKLPKLWAPWHWQWTRTLQRTSSEPTLSTVQREKPFSCYSPQVVDKMDTNCGFNTPPHSILDFDLKRLKRLNLSIPVATLKSRPSDNSSNILFLPQIGTDFPLFFHENS